MMNTKTFNVTGRCIPEKHYMVDISDKLAEITHMVDQGYYFVINRARQYGKTTTLRLLAKHLDAEYAVIALDFQKLSYAQFQDEETFSCFFAELFVKAAKQADQKSEFFVGQTLESLNIAAQNTKIKTLGQLFSYLSDLCDNANRKVVLMIDEVDSASNNQVFLDFLAQLRGYYLDRDTTSTFYSVILAGVYDIKNLKLRLRPESEHKYNSLWNIAEAFEVDMSLSEKGISGMLEDYEADHHSGMKCQEVAHCIYEYTSGYPFLVSLICKTIDNTVSVRSDRLQGAAAWSEAGVREAVKLILKEQSTIFESMMRQLDSHRELRDMLYAILFCGSKLTFNPDNMAVSLGTMFGFICEEDGCIAISNRIFEMRLYNFFLAEEQLASPIYQEAQTNKNQFIRNGMLDMDLVMKKFVACYSDIYGNNDQKFVEKHGRKLFLLYLKPIINGTGNYYIEAETRDAKRTDVIADYLGKQFVVEMKIWNGEKYNQEGEKQLVGYLERYHLERGYLLTFHFNRDKNVGVKEVALGKKILVEAVV